MSPQLILSGAIDKAVAGGWKPFEYGTPTRIERWQGDHMINVAIVFPLHKDPIDWVRELEGIIFNHDFAKALWPYKPHDAAYGDSCSSCGSKDVSIDCWQGHLQQMVIADDPIAYLGQNI